jgi:uncharacterized membrane protein
MSPAWFLPLSLLAALACALVAGLFLGFSSFVMRALGERPPAEGIAVMQAINRVILRSAFIALFLLATLLAVALGLLALLDWTPASPWLLAGALLQALGSFGVTLAGNVPLNEALARAEPRNAAGAALWADYLRRWTRWNHLRTAAGIAAAAAFGLAPLA